MRCLTRQVYYDLKKLLEESNAPVPSQLAHHEAAKIKPGSIDARPRREQTIFAKK
jgi:ATP-dependent RNA helicase DDX23/PRP28